MELETEITQYNFRNVYHKAAVNLIYTFNWLYGLQSEIFKPFNITTQQLNILRILRGQYPKPATIKLLKERMLDKMSDASRIVEKLRIKGLVERQICIRDRRTVDVLISANGLNLLSKLDEKNKELDKILSHLSDEELKALNRLLDKLRG
jgi:DNA-binding MarR family transcriptional regulator